MAKKGIFNPNFKGFMVDSAKANWNIVYIVYGSCDLTIDMDDKK
jgi:hypothetical protein